MRAFRPSQFSPADELDEDTEQAKAFNLQVYTERVQAGLPLFDKGSSAPTTDVDMDAQSKTA